MRRFPSFFLPLWISLAVAGAIPTPTKKTSKKPVAKTAVAKGKQVSRRRGTGKRGVPRSHAAPVERSQAAPTSDRLREIQQALAAKGYLKSEPTGVWDADSQDAMRRFQSDQKLDQSGKITSLSLISLGLSPTH